MEAHQWQLNQANSQSTTVRSTTLQKWWVHTTGGHSHAGLLVACITPTAEQ